MAKLSNITPGIAVVKERIKSTDVLRVGINAMGLVCVGTEDERLKSDVVCALEPAKGLFLNNPRAVCEISVIDDSFSSIYRLEKKFCITDALYIDPQQIAAACSLPYTPAQRILLTPKMILDLQAIMCGQSNVNVCEYLKFSANALSIPGTPIYGLTVNKVFIKDRRSEYMTRIPDEQWSMSDTYKDIVWKSLVSIAFNYIQKNPDATPDDICMMYIKTYGSSWITKLVVFNSKPADIELPKFMTALASPSISSKQLVNAYQLMLAILKGRFCGINRMDRDDTAEYIKSMQKEIADKINSALGDAEDIDALQNDKPDQDQHKEKPVDTEDKNTDSGSEEKPDDESDKKSDTKHDTKSDVKSDKKSDSDEGKSHDKHDDDKEEADGEEEGEYTEDEE